MPNRVRSLWVLLIPTLLATCNPRLDLDPSVDIPFKESITNEADLVNTLTASYSALRSADCLGGSFRVWPDISGDMVTLNPTNNRFISELGIYNRNFESLADDSVVIKNWQTAYKAINRANEVIEAVNKGKVSVNSTSRQYKGEALIIRAITYFELAKWYAPHYTQGNLGALAIPMPTTPTRERKQIGRATVVALYNQIEKDLQEAAGLLPARYGRDDNPNLGSFTGDAARAYLAKVYFHEGRNDLALPLINTLIGNPLDSVSNQTQVSTILNDDANLNYPKNYPMLQVSGTRGVDQIFSNNGRFFLSTVTSAQTGDSYYETIAQLMNNSNVSTSVGLVLRYSYRPTANMPSPQYVPSTNFLASFTSAVPVFKTTTDRRYIDLFIQFPNRTDPRLNVNGRERRAINKFATSSISSGINILLVRSPELMLMRAEILAQRGGSDNLLKAVTDLAFVKQRSNALILNGGAITPGRELDDVPTLNRNARNGQAEAILTEIRNERLRELCFEGDRFHDLRRRGIPVPASEGRPEFSIPSDRGVIPIPVTEQLTNSNL